MLNPIEEAKYAELRDKCRELRLPPPPETHVHLKVVDKYGKETFNDIQRAHSWTRNFYNSLYGMPLYYSGSTSSFGAGYFSLKNTVGEYSSYLRTYALQIRTQNTGVSEKGLVIGTGDTASSVADYKMDTPIVHGTGSGQMSYQESNGPAANYTGATKIWDFTYYRIFNNNSGALITVKECGYLEEHAPYSSKYMLMERTVLSPTVAVADGAQLTVTYVLTLDFSAID